jgi:prepilin peptidase CpaA
LNLIATAPLWLVAVLCCAMVAAAVEDAARFRISNVTVVIVLITAIAAALIVGVSWSLWQNVAIFIGMLLIGSLAFSAGWLGGGDVKLFAAAGLWFNLYSVVTFVPIVLLSGGLVAVCYLLIRPFRRVPAGGKNSRRIPYGIAIALGTVAMVLMAHATGSRHERPMAPNKYIPFRS